MTHNVHCLGNTDNSTVVCTQIQCTCWGIQIIIVVHAQVQCTCFLPDPQVAVEACVFAEALESSNPVVNECTVLLSGMKMSEALTHTIYSVSHCSH